MSPRCRLTFALLAAALLAACGAGAPSDQAVTPQPTARADAAAPTTTADRTAPAAATSQLVAPASPEALASLAGSIQIDGSSTVFPITEAVASAFRGLAPGVDINLGVSGTSAGFERFCAGETTISDASRPIKEAEAAGCGAAGVAFVELPVAYDGISVAVNASNSWAACLTTDELRRIWEPAAEGRITSWRDVRPEWPAVPLTLYGAGSDSGTFDYFTAAIVGSEDAIRADYTGSEDDYLLAQDLSADAGGMGFFGYSYMIEYERELRPLAIDHGAGCVGPSEATIADGSYQPLSRPIFIYVRADALARPEVAAFVEFYLANAPTLVRAARYIPLPARAYELALARARDRVTGSVFPGDIPVGVSLERLLELEGSRKP